MWQFQHTPAFNRLSQRPSTSHLRLDVSDGADWGVQLLPRSALHNLRLLCPPPLQHKSLVLVVPKVKAEQHVLLLLQTTQAATAPAASLRRRGMFCERKIVQHVKFLCCTLGRYRIYCGDHGGT
jgi:hypothetical protein